MLLPLRSTAVRCVFWRSVRASATAPSSPMESKASSSEESRVRVDVARRHESSAATNGPKSGPWPDTCADSMCCADGSRSITISSSSRDSWSIAWL